jgi:hypothetical protein
VAVLWTARRLGSVGWAIGLGCLSAAWPATSIAGSSGRPPFCGRGRPLHVPNTGVQRRRHLHLIAPVIILQALRGVRVDGGRHEEPARDREPPATDPGAAGGGTCP